MTPDIPVGILAILQARVSSSRLPGKVLRPILGEPMLFRQIERIRRARLIERLVVATSVDASDDPLAEMCRERGIDCFRGSLADVLDRFFRAAGRYAPEHVVRLTGDCPLADPAVIDATIGLHLSGGYDYTSNALEPTFPDGLDVEVMRFACLEQAWREATLPSQREHVTPFLYRHPERFRLGVLKNGTDLSGLRWTVDEPADFEFVTRVYEALYPADQAFTSDDILGLLQKHRDYQEINRSIGRNEGYRLSLAKDADSPEKTR